MRFFITLSIACLPLITAAQHPNILLIIADDLGLDPTPNYLPGPEKAAMPHLESLMAQGLTFDNVWVNPLCAPTRSTIITGKYGESTQVLNVQDQSTLGLEEVTLFEYLQQINSGYATSVIGKWHLGGQTPALTDPNDQGVPHYSGILAGGVQSYTNWQQTTNGAQTTNTTYITRVLTDSALTWIGRQTQPWFCWLAHVAPHVPFHRPPLFMHNQGPLPTNADSISANPRPYFLAMIEALDFELGRMMDSLGTDMLANTVIIFIGDNGTDGDVIQAPYLTNRAKNSLYQGGVHVPLVIAGPGITRPNEREPALVNGTDLFATIMELTGITLPQFEQSKSLVSLFTQTGLEHRSCLRTEVEGDMNGGRAFRDVRYKVIQKSNGDQEFYDLLDDPFEANDLLSGTLTGDQQKTLDQLLSGCDITAGQEENAPASLLLHPVPASTFLFVEGGNGKDYSISSIDGRWVRNGTIQNGTVDVSGLPSGGYSLSIGTRHATFIKVE